VKEPRVEQVPGGVLDAADVLIDGQPVVCLLAGEGRCVVACVGIAGKVPRAIDEGVHRVRLALGRAAALGAGGVHPFFHRKQRILGGFAHLYVVRQQHGQVFVGDGYRAARGTVDDGNGVAPVSLAAHVPVAQAVGGGALAPAMLGNVQRDGVLGLRAGHAVKVAAVHHHAGFGVGAVHVGQSQAAVRVLDDDAHGDAIAPRELEIALVVRGHGHHGAVAVVHAHVIGHPYLHRFAV